MNNKELSAILKEKYGNSATAKRAQLRNEIVVRGDEILAELAKGWSLRAIWTALSERKELTCGYKTFIAHVRRLQHQAAMHPNQGDHARKTKRIHLESTAKN